MAAYTLVQLVEVLVFGSVLLFGVLVRSPSIAILGGGFLIGKAVLNILAPEGAGGMLAFDLDGGREAVQRMLSRLEMVRFAASLGGVETTISYPEITSHRAFTPEERASLGVGSGTIRVSVGIEAAEDIVADFAHALAL